MRKDEKMREKKIGSSFAVDIREIRDGCWIGEVTWANTGETVPFRSALELICLINSAVEKTEGSKKNNQKEEKNTY